MVRTVPLGCDSSVADFVSYAKELESSQPTNVEILLDCINQIAVNCLGHVVRCDFSDPLKQATVEPGSSLLAMEPQDGKNKGAFEKKPPKLQPVYFCKAYLKGRMPQVG